MKDHTNRLFEFVVERLEDREMMAGDVSVRVHGDNVIVVGSNSNDEINVSYHGDYGSIVIAGIDGSGTTVNGSDVYATGLNSIGRLTIRLRGGDDRISFRSVQVTKVAKINLGSAVMGDTVAFNNRVEFETLRLRGSSKSDEVTFGSPIIHNGMKLNMGAGGDFVGISTLAQLHGTQIIKMGVGDDNIRFNAAIENASQIRFIGNSGQDSLMIEPELLDDPLVHVQAIEEFFVPF